uniref:Claudin-1-like n=1 Tax=Crassostrea virginica TaxID=6565 RepID=A0A8B8BLF9_CRAVI|nr:claudin-1-like [Crassostrea virginica]
MEGSKFILVGAVLAFCAFILQVIGLASPYWVTYDYGGAKVYMGLWKFCVKNTLGTNCVDSSDIILKAEWLSAVKAMSIMGLLALIVALGMAGLKLFVMKENKVLRLVAITATFAAAGFILISIAVYAAKMNDLFPTILKYHFAFAFCILAMLSAIGAGCLMLKDAML